MPQVPYKPYSSVTPTEKGAPELKINTPGAAFGETVAHALQGLGHVTEQAGNEMFTRAHAIQQLNNESEAKEADAKYMVAVGEKHAQFSALQGKAASDAYPAYMQDMQDLRKSFRDGLSNDMARKMYDSSSLSTMGRTIFNGAGHAATQNKVYANNASKARVDGLLQGILANPKDDVGFQSGLKKMLGEVDAQGDIGGWSKEQVDREKASHLSLALAHRITGLAKEDPPAAAKMLAENREKILYQHVEATQNKVQHELHTTAARVASDNINAGWAPYMKPNEVDRAAGVDETLLRVIKRAQRDNPDIKFTIPGEGGRRSQETQNELVRQGYSQTFNSEHLTGRAIDLAPIGADGKPDFKDREGYRKIEGAMEKAAEAEGIQLHPKSERFKSWDPGHYSLAKDFDVSKAPKAVEESLQSRVDRAERFARETAPDDPAFKEYVRDRTEGDYVKSRTVKRDDLFRNTNTIDGALVGNNGRIPTTVEELKASSPQVAAAWDSLDETHQKRYLKELSRTRAVKDDLTVYQRLRGMAQDDPAGFLDHDILGEEKLSDSSKKHFVNMQASLKSKAESDPRVTRAMQQLAPALNAAGLTKAKDKDGYWQFQGALQDQLEAYSAEHKKSMPPAEIEKVGAQLMQQQPSGNDWLWGLWPGKERTFAIPVPEAERAKAEEALKQAFPGVEPSEEQIQRLYIRKKFKELYGGAKKSE